MNKYNSLTKALVKNSAVSLAICGAAIALYLGIGYFADSVAEEKRRVEDKVSEDQRTLQTLQDQMNKSSVAEKAYAQLQEARSTVRYDGTKEEFLQVLRDFNSFYHFTDFRVPRTIPDVISTKPELKELPHNVVLRSIKLDFRAISDLHIFSFIEEMKRTAPGLIRVDSLDISRTTDATDAIINQMSSGTAPALVNATLGITWIVITEKAKNTPAANTANGQAAPAQVGAVGGAP